MEKFGIAPMICQVEHPEYGIIGFVVVNSSVHIRGVGGVRMTSDVTIQETKQLARAMTYKFGFLNMPCSGAKTGIIASPSWYPDRQQEILNYFGAAIGPLLRNRVYTPGPDIGFGRIELWDLLHGAGLARGERPSTVRRKAAGTTGYTTGITVFQSAKAAIEILGLEMNKVKVAIEGFGMVGSTVAQFFHKEGAKIVAISNIQGALYHPDGLIIDELDRLREQNGDKGVLQYKDAQSIPHSDLLELPVDVLIPAAKIWTIHNKNIDKLKCRIISSAANCPLHPEVEKKFLQQKDIIFIPDFVANCGGVLGANLHGTTQSKLNLMQQKFGNMVLHLLRKSFKSNISFEQLAREIAEKNITFYQKNPQKAHKEAKLLDITATLSSQRFVPSKMKDFLMKRYLQKWIPQT
jgi:glutamate dehydrogenase (NAD(P)+)